LLESQHTIDVYDFGLTGEGTFYYAMELLNGIDLDALVTEYGPLNPERVAHVLVGASRSLAEAHERGLIHRDIKPTNIFLCRKGLDYDFVKVLDFGIVKTAFDTGEATMDLTAHGNILGTPAFIAPEMAMGDGKIDGRADLYALGCVAYWLLTGTRVFDADSPVAMALHHVKTEPVPLSSRTEIDVPPAFEELVLRCLAKDPAQRPQSASDLATQISAVPFGAPWTPERAERWWSTHLPDHVVPAGPAP
jgi:serine/threonine-protein kinase